MQRMNLKVTIKLLTPLFVGGDEGADANVSYILRDVHENAYYPGTAFKGKARHYVRGLQRGGCVFPEPCDCAVCRLFGGEGNARGSLSFSDFFPEETPVTDVRMGNSIDRFRGVAEDEKLFMTESAAIRKLVGYVTGNVEDKDRKLLISGIKLIQQIGGGTSRGFGWIDGEIEVCEESAETENEGDGSLKKGFANCVRVTVTPRSPLLIGKHTTQSNFRDTQRVIPGSVFRAAVARAICDRDGTSDPSEDGIFKDRPQGKATLFPNLREFSKSLRFSTLNPKKPKNPTKPTNSTLQPVPFPLTARKCKYEEGHVKSEDQCRYFDVLAAMLRGDEMQCPYCAERLEKVNPFEAMESWGEKLTVTSTHSEMDKWRGTSRDERLYTVRAIAPEAVVFSGTISGELDLQDLSRLFREPLRVGAMISSGFGECVVEFEPEEQNLEENRDQMVERIKQFKKLLGGSGDLVPITLLSDAFVDLQEPDDGDYIKAYAGLVTHFEVVRVIAKTQVWRGFETSKKSAAKKPCQFLLKAGSVIVVRAADLNKETIGWLSELEQNGIGTGTADGYGAVRVAHEYHITNALVKKEDSLNG